ncbi:ATP-binding protein [uncultured Intestinimonas sp.]|uniref:ATP-binding protein n=1 Tax=uncultured Intestinimonas sp. TaxID=1689265 RepID=UPI00261A18FB|nr:ATP-binding protein [uncultured Intestinimonas sp.]
MKELALHMLDIAQNSIAAGARRVVLTVEESGGRIRLEAADDGRGMDPAFLARVTDPFTTTRTTRKVGLGLPLLRLAAEQTGGGLEIRSAPGKGTTVTAAFFSGHIDCPPLGDMAATVALLVQGLPEGMDLVYAHRRGGETFQMDTAQLREILGPEVPLSLPEVTRWVEDYIREGERELPPEEK